MEMGGQKHALVSFHPGKGPGTHGTGGWVGSRAGLDGCGIFDLHRDLYYTQRIANSVCGRNRGFEICSGSPICWCSWTKVSVTQIIKRLTIG